MDQIKVTARNAYSAKVQAYPDFSHLTKPIMFKIIIEPEDEIYGRVGDFVCSLSGESYVICVYNERKIFFSEYFLRPVKTTVKTLYNANRDSRSSKWVVNQRMFHEGDI